MSCARAGPSLCWLCTAEECCGLGWGRLCVWRGVGWVGGGGLVRRWVGPQVLGEEEGGGLSGAFLAYFRSIPFCFKIPPFSPVCDRAVQQSQRQEGEGSAALHFLSAPPRLLREAFRFGWRCGKKRRLPPLCLFASCRGDRCVIAAAPSARLKNCAESFAKQRGFVCVLGIAATL